MFTQGQWIFAGIATVAFIILMIIMYRRDAALNKRYYPKTWPILIGFFLFLALLFTVKMCTR